MHYKYINKQKIPLTILAHMQYRFLPNTNRQAGVECLNKSFAGHRKNPCCAQIYLAPTIALVFILSEVPQGHRIIQ
jgi:hypothetical protein